MDNDTPIGKRIAYYRNRIGMSQRTLAQLIGKSTVWLSKVERGALLMDSITVLHRLANILKVDIWQLMPKLGLPPNGGASLDPPNGIPAIRRSVFLDPRDSAPPAREWLAGRVAYAERLIADGRFHAVALLLPELVNAARTFSASGGEPAGWGYLARTYIAASSLARNVGEPELAWLTADRAVTAARRSDDPVLVASCVRMLGGALLHTGCFDEAGAVCSDGADALAPTDGSRLEVWSLWGSLKLSEAISAVRLEDPANARRTLLDARTAADRVGPGRNDYWEAFGPANVSAHEIAVALEAHDPLEALRVGDRLEVDDLPHPERRARVLIDIARAHRLRENDGATVAALLEAERHAPEVVRHQALARELVRICLHRARQSATPGLSGLASRLAITD